MLPWIDIYVVTALGDTEITETHIKVKLTNYGDHETTVIVDIPEDETVKPLGLKSGESITVTKRVDLVPLSGQLLEKGK